MRGKIFGIALVILAIFSICGALPGIVNIEPVSASPGIIYVPDNYTEIQWAVDNATSGDTIIVRDGTYTENIHVGTEHLTIRAENGTDSTIVQAANGNDSVFEVNANYVTIIGVTVENASGINMAGIYLDTVNHCNISSNNATGNYYGILLYSSSNNTLMNNTANSNNDYGIELRSSSNNTVTNNTVSNNGVGIYLDSSSNNTLTGNNMTGNAYGIQMVWWSSNNTLMGNTVSNNGDGIYLYSSSNNIIYNNYFNNTNNAHDDGFNTWNTTKQAGANIIGGSWLGGNYWLDYAGSDTDGDGLGNTVLPYTCSGEIYNGGDYLPLVTYIDVMRNLPNTVQRGETFNVTATFTAPADKFNAISLTDLAPDSWNVTVNGTWCSPNADAVEATGNKTEIAWFGEPGVGFDNGTSFDVLYKVTVPDDASAGIYIFNGFLEYYLAAEGPYYESIRGDSQAEVTFPALEGHVDLFRKEAAGGPTWETPIVVRFFDNSTKNETAWSPINVTTDAYGNFTIKDVCPGTYDVGVKNWTTLSKMAYTKEFTGATVIPINFGALIEADCNDNDMVDGWDYSLVLNNYGAMKIADPAGWAANEFWKADFNRDYMLDGWDYAAVLNNYGDFGEIFIYTH